MSKTVIAVARIALAAALIFTLYAAFVPTPDAPSFLPWDKASHFAAFFVLAILAALAFPSTRLLNIALALSVLGASIEVVQGLPAVHRDLDVMDWLVDTVTVAAAFWPGMVHTARARLRQNAGDASLAPARSRADTL